MVEYGEGKCQSPMGISSLWLRYARVTINPQILLAYYTKVFFSYSLYMLVDQQKCRPLSLILASRMKKKPVSRHCWNHGTMWRRLKLLFGADITISTPVHWSQGDIRLSLLSKKQEGWPWKVGNILITFKCTTSNLVIMVWYLTIPHSELNDL